MLGKFSKGVMSNSRNALYYVIEVITFKFLKGTVRRIFLKKIERNEKKFMSSFTLQVAYGKILWRNTQKCDSYGSLSTPLPLRSSLPPSHSHTQLRKSCLSV